MVNRPDLADKQWNEIKDEYLEKRFGDEKSLCKVPFVYGKLQSLKSTTFNAIRSIIKGG